MDRLRDRGPRTVVVRCGIGPGAQRRFRGIQVDQGVAENLIGRCLGQIALACGDVRVENGCGMQVPDRRRDVGHRPHAMPLIVVVSPSELRVHRAQERDRPLICREGERRGAVPRRI